MISNPTYIEYARRTKFARQYVSRNLGTLSANTGYRAHGIAPLSISLGAGSSFVKVSNE